MDCILGADFLMHSSKVSSVSSNSIVWKSRGKTHRVRVADESQVNSLESINTYIKRYDPKNLVRQDLECIECTEGITSTKIKANTIQITDLMGETIVMGSDMEKVKTTFEQNRMDSGKDDITETSEYLGNIRINSHSVRTEYVDETLPESTEMFEDSQELKEEVLTKKITLADGDYSQCPPEHLGQLKELLEDFKDRFSESKLDLEITDMYTAELETVPGKIVNQKCRRLPNDRFEFAKRAIKQLMQMGVISESDSEWRSNVVMVPKPQSGELRENSKSDMLDKTKKVELYRICLDFRELNNALVFPKQVQFVNLETLGFESKAKYTEMWRNRWPCSLS
jgi:hypothetical protein